MSNYWIDRVKREEALTFNKSKELIKDIQEVYKAAYNQVKSSIDSLEVSVRNNEMELDLLEANKLISKEERIELEKNIKRSLKGYEELAKSIDYKNIRDFKEVYKFKSLQNMGYTSRISRLKARQIEIDAILNNLAKQQELMLAKHLEEVYEDTYYKTAYINALQGGNFETISRLDSATIVKAVKKSWVADGKNFSDRIWKNAAMLSRDIAKELTVNIAIGKGTRNLAEKIRKRYNVTLSQASRLVQTETSAIRNQATLDRYKEDNIEQYQIIAVLDSKTSNICQSMDRKVFNSKDSAIGVNYPPFHVNCRSTTKAYFEFLEEEKPKDKTRTKDDNIDIKINYEDWKEKYIEKNKNSDILEVKSDILKDLKKSNIEYNKVEKLKKPLTDKEIIEKISGGDLTKGSCASLSLAYAGNKIGYDVVDYRGGSSLEYFASNFKNLQNLDKLVSWVEESTNDFEAINKLILHMEFNKEYCLATGKHAAIIKKIINNDGVKEYQYLELQSGIYERNKYYKLTYEKLKTRFKCVKTHTLKNIGKYKAKSYLIDIESFKENKEFEEILGYINTDIKKQQKGVKGYEK